jgi:hypothetical protein
MKVGDLVMSAEFGACDGEGLGIIMEPPRLSYYRQPVGDADGETYYIIKVLFPAGIIDVLEEDIEVM